MAKLAEVKTKPNEANVESSLKTIDNEQKLADTRTILKMMEKATKEKPKMWGASIIGFGYKVVKSETSGREVEWFDIGVSPRKTNISVYLNGVQKHEAALTKLGKHKTGTGCLYINKLADVDVKVLEKIINDTVK